MADIIEAMGAGALLHLEWADGEAAWWLSGIGWPERPVPDFIAAAVLKHPRVRPCGDALFEKTQSQSWEIGNDHDRA